MKTNIELTEGLIYKMGMLGIPNGCATNVCFDNDAVNINNIIADSELKKETPFDCVP